MPLHIRSQCLHWKCTLSITIPPSTMPFLQRVLAGEHQPGSSSSAAARPLSGAPAVAAASASVPSYSTSSPIADASLQPGMPPPAQPSQKPARPGSAARSGRSEGGGGSSGSAPDNQISSIPNPAFKSARGDDSAVPAAAAAAHAPTPAPAGGASAAAKRSPAEQQQQAQQQSQQQQRLLHSSSSRRTTREPTVLDGAGGTLPACLPCLPALPALLVIMLISDTAVFCNALCVNEAFASFHF
jgi:hypothetical protein